MSFATDMAFSPRPGEATPRNVFVPPWYRPHADLSLAVLGADGKPLGFQVGDVVAERRWAIDETGRCMSQADFEPKLLEWRKGQFEWQVPPKRTPDLMFEPVPKVEGYVARGEDPADHRRLISLEPLRPRIGMLRPNEPLVDESLLKDPRWRAAPKKETSEDAEIRRLKAEIESMRAAPVAEVPAIEKAPKQARNYVMMTCPDCGQGGLKGSNGLRFHRKHKHAGTA